jgi:PAS domain S-box-containing protein
MDALRERTNKYLLSLKASVRRKFALRGTAVAFLVLIVSLVITTVVWRYNVDVSRYQAQIKFDLLSKDIEFVVENRITRNIDILSGVRGFFQASSNVTRKEFNIFVKNQIGSNYPTLRSVSYIPRILNTQKNDFITSVKNDTTLVANGYPSFTITPTGSRSEYYVAQYLEPMNDETRSAFGYDLRTNPVRASAIEKARDTGLPTISLKTQTIGAEKEAFVVYIPLYTSKAIPETLSARRLAFKGVIGGTFDLDSFFRQVFPEQELYHGVDFEIYDGENISSEHLLYDSNTAVESTVERGKGYYRKVARVTIAGNTWIIYTSASRESILGYTSSHFPTIVALGGLVASLSLFGIVLSFATARRRAIEIADSITAKLAESEEKYRAIFDALQDVYYRTDLAGVITMISPSIEKQIGIPPSQVVGKNASDFYVDPHARDEMLSILMKKGVITDHILELRAAPRKKIINASLNARLLKNERGEPIGVEGMLRDVTERAISEEKLKERTKELEIIKDRIERETHKLNAILSSMGESLIAVDDDGKVMLMNQAASVALRIAEGDARGKKIEEILKLYKNKSPLAETESPIYKALKEKGIARTFMHDDIYAQDKEGQLFPVVLSATSLLGRGGVEGISGIIMFRNVLEEKTIDTAKTEFVSLASHQLRTPLTAINWYTEMLLSGDVGKINKEQKKYLEEIYHGNQRMVDLVSALLNVSRIDLGTFAVEPEPTNLKSVAESVLLELEPMIQKKQLKISQKYSRGVTALMFDSKLIRIIFQNLLSNSVKYTPEKGAVDVSVEVKDEKVRIVVADTGYGIPKDDQEKIFTKLYRADNIREKDADGTGLGLYIVKAIIEQSGGTISFVSEENKGTTFHVTFPKSGMKPKSGNKGLS